MHYILKKGPISMYRRIRFLSQSTPPKKKIQNGPRPFQKGCETVISFIFILAGRSEMRTFYLELLQNFKFEVGHKNVSIYFSLDTLKSGAYRGGGLSRCLGTPPFSAPKALKIRGFARKLGFLGRF